ncbi:hypothetical protein C8R45DRAFT_940834 [Mycena sanguinolenta]|nr:hypothetical protein C8R45DRAFT_940834 [Mycena sanguinolenta]
MPQNAHANHPYEAAHYRRKAGTRPVRWLQPGGRAKRRAGTMYCWRCSGSGPMRAVSGSSTSDGAFASWVVGGRVANGKFYEQEAAQRFGGDVDVFLGTPIGCCVRRIEDGRGGGRENDGLQTVKRKAVYSDNGTLSGLFKKCRQGLLSRAQKGTTVAQSKARIGRDTAKRSKKLLKSTHPAEYVAETTDFKPSGKLPVKRDTDFPGRLRQQKRKEIKQAEERCCQQIYQEFGPTFYKKIWRVWFEGG